MVLNNEEQEFLDVVNENDEVIYSKPRTLVHKEGLLHREIHVWFFDKDKNIFFQKRGSEKSSAGLFDATVGGHVDAGENYLDTAVREIKEEISIDINTQDLILIKKFRNTFIDQNKKLVNNFIRNIYLYKYPISIEQIKKEEGVPGVDFQKFSVKEIISLPEEKKQIFDFFILEHEIPFVIRSIETIFDQTQKL